jgi:hypothetical protein
VRVFAQGFTRDDSPGEDERWSRGSELAPRWMLYWEDSKYDDSQREGSSEFGDALDIRLEGLTLRVADVGRLIEFYGNKLGFTVRRFKSEVQQCSIDSMAE